MRFLKIFFLSCVSLAFLAVVCVGLYVETVIRLSAWELRKDMEAVTMWAVNPLEDHVALCLKRTPLVINKETETTNKETAKYPIQAYQLRFINQTDYSIEVICQIRPDKPEVIKAGTLHRGVTKTVGSGVRVPVVLPKYTTGSLTGVVELKFYYRKLKVGLIDGKTGWQMLSKNEIFEAGMAIPSDTCEGWGYTCCSDIMEVGVGDVYKGATDCPSDCFSRCDQRPMLLFFNTQPVLDFNNRLLTVVGHQVEVTFGWEITDADSLVQKVTVEFGDGEKYETQAMKGITSHVFNCNQNKCEYIAEIKAVDQQGYTMSQTKISQVKISLKN